MATETPALHVTVAANLEKLRQDLGDAKTLIDSTVQSFTRAREAAPAVTQLATATKDLGGQAQQAATFTQNLHGALQQFDGVLNSVGLNINREVRALAEIGQASGKTAGELGALTSAGLFVGAAFAGVEFGRWIAGLIGADAAVSRLTTNLFGLNDVEEETARARIDTIEKVQRITGHTVSYGEAVAFLTQQQKEAQAAQKAYEIGLKAVTEAGQGWEQTLTTIDGTVVEAIKFYLAAGVSQKDLAGAYGLTAAQIRAVANAREHDIETIKLWDQIHKTTFELAQQHEKQWHDESMRLLEERNRAVVAGVEQNEKAEQDLIDFYAQSTLSSTNYQIFKIQEVAREQEAAFKGTLEQRVIFNQRVDELANQQAERLKAKEREVVATAVQAALDAANALASIIPDIGHGPTAPNGGGGPAPINVSPIVLPPVIHQSGIVTGQNTNLTARAGGGPVSAGAPYLVGERGPELFVPGSNGSIVPNGGAGAVSITNHITVNGNVLGSELQLQRAIDTAVVNGLKNAGVRLPSRV